VDANALLVPMDEMFRRTIGEGITLAYVKVDDLWLTLCDPNQLESSLLNLVLNARDAMADGGALTIETGNARFDEREASELSDVQAGEYVVVKVTDTGTGMSAQTISQAFDPFFTTKAIGAGTGLGLSMVYGFARQSQGFAQIHSDPGVGTTVALYLPRHVGNPVLITSPDERPPAQPIGRGETILVIEDDQIVRSLIIDMLSEFGYQTLEADDGLRGLAILQSDVRIDLLVTDIGLPGADGRQVAEAARMHRPDLKILFMTGYAEKAAGAEGFLVRNMEMITKPFLVDEFSARVRAMLEP
jgi:CheY-like chemotaxis protein